VARVHDRDGKPRPTEPSESPGPVPSVNGEMPKGEEKGGWSGKLEKPKAEVLPPGPESTGTGVDPFQIQYPALVAFVRDCTFADGTRRTPGSIVLFVQDGLFTLCLSDKGQPEQVAFQSARTVSLALRTAEDGLKANDLPWRRPKRTWKGQRA